MVKSGCWLGLLALLCMHPVCAWSRPAGREHHHQPPVSHHAAHKVPKQAAVEARHQPPPFVVAIDAGHGGKDTGAIGPGGVYEKQVVYAISRRLENLLQKDPDMLPVLVRKGDRFIGLQQRSAIARQAGADLLVSIHADADPHGNAKGSSVFTLMHRGRHAEPSSATRRASQRAAAKILRELRTQQTLHCRQVKKARFAVLKTPGVPSMLIETGFISNPQEEKKLASPAHQEKLARSIYGGIRAYAKGAGHKPAHSKKLLLASRQ